MDEGRLDEVFLDELVEEGLHDVTGAVPALLQGDFVFLGEADGFLEGNVLGEVDAGLLFDGLRHGNPAEGLGEVNFDVAPPHLFRA